MTNVNILYRKIWLCKRRRSLRNFLTVSFLDTHTIFTYRIYAPAHMSTTDSYGTFSMKANRISKIVLNSC